ncbi:MAG: hypothetical protein II984_10500 [Clostridia bacterium]|nr:hypothetical protein [Clostridia bacterium]
MKNRFLLFTLIVLSLVCLFAISISAEAVYVNHNGEQVSADSEDIAYEIELEKAFEKNGNCKMKYIYLHDETVTKIVIPAIELTHSNGTVYKMAEYDYVRLSTGWDGTLSVYTLADKDTKSNSLHSQMTELEFHVPVLGDGAGQKGNLAGWTSLEKISYFSRAYEPQNKGGYLYNCVSLREIHFYGENNMLSGNFFPSNSITGGLVVFHEDATGTIRECAMQALNGKDWTVYLNTKMQPKTADDPRLTWNKSGNSLKFILLVNDDSVYTEEQIASYETFWQAGNNKNANNAKYSMSIQSYCDYYGEHVSMEALSTCVSKCLSCGEIAIPKNPVHNESVTIVYDDFAANGTKTTKCLNENCPLNTEPKVENAEPLFIFKGYSTDGKEICVGYVINVNAIDEYKALNPEKSFKYGIVASANNNNPIDVTANTINVDLTNEKYTALDFKLTGDWSKEASASAKLSMNIYTSVADGEGAKVSYVYGYTDGDTIISASYDVADQITYKDLNSQAE